MNIQRCKGSRDLSISEMRCFRYIEQIFRDSCLMWGFQEVRTPTLEYLHLFTSTGTLTPAMLNKVYSFLDWDGWSGERVVLRPDGTIPIARLFIENAAEKETAKLFYISNMFIFEEDPDAPRERWQGGVELIGANSPLADVELISIAMEVLKKLKLNNVVLKLSHAGLMRTLLSKLGLSHEKQEQFIDRIKNGQTDELAKTQNISNRSILKIFELKGKSSNILRNLKGVLENDYEELTPDLDDFINITVLLESMGIPYEIDLKSGLGFEYYTGVVYQFSVNNKHVGGGGRYNALIPLMGGSDVPASGFALYLTQLMELINVSEIPMDNRSGLEIKIKSFDNEMIKLGNSLLETLHGLGTIGDFLLDDTTSSNIRWILDLTNKEQFTLTDRFTKKEIKVSCVEEVIEMIQNGHTSKNSVT